MINLVNQLLFIEVKILIDEILKEYDYCREVTKNHFNKYLVMPKRDEQTFQSSNKCWICDKIFDVGDNKVREIVI